MRARTQVGHDIWIEDLEGGQQIHELIRAGDAYVAENLEDQPGVYC